MSKTKFTQLINFVIEETIWGPISLMKNDSIHRKRSTESKVLLITKELAH